MHVEQASISLERTEISLAEKQEQLLTAWQDGRVFGATVLADETGTRITSLMFKVLDQQGQWQILSSGPRQWANRFGNEAITLMNFQDKEECRVAIQGMEIDGVSYPDLPVQVRQKGEKARRDLVGIHPDHTGMDAQYQPIFDQVWSQLGQAAVRAELKPGKPRKDGKQPPVLVEFTAGEEVSQLPLGALMAGMGVDARRENGKRVYPVDGRVVDPQTITPHDFAAALARCEYGGQQLPILVVADGEIVNPYKVTRRLEDVAMAEALLGAVHASQEDEWWNNHEAEQLEAEQFALQQEITAMDHIDPEVSWWLEAEQSEFEDAKIQAELIKQSGVYEDSLAQKRWDVRNLATKTGKIRRHKHSNDSESENEDRRREKSVESRSRRRRHMLHRSWPAEWNVSRVDALEQRLQSMGQSRRNTVVQEPQMVSDESLKKPVIESAYQVQPEPFFRRSDFYDDGKRTPNTSGKSIVR